MEIDCSGTVLAKYFGKKFDQISLGCPSFLRRNEDRRLVQQYNRKPSRYRKSVDEVVKEVKGRVSVSYSNLVHREPRLSTVVAPPESDPPSEPPQPEVTFQPDPPADSASAESQVLKNGLYYLGRCACSTASGAGIGAVGLGALAAVGIVAVGGAACSVLLIERLLCVDPEYQERLKALEVPNVYRPDIYNNLYEYRSPYRY